MNIKPMGGQPQQAAQTTNQTDSRARAINAFMEAGKVQQPTPVPNPTQISPEEMSAVTSEVRQNDEAVTTPVEAAKPVETPEQQALSRQYAQLARQAKEQRQLAQQAKEREAALIAREEALKAKEAELSRPTTPQGKYYTPEQLKRDALRILSEEGVSYDDLTQQVLNQSNRDPQVMAMFDEMNQKLAAQEAKIKAYEESQQKSQADQYQAALKQIGKDVNQLVFTDPEFEMIKVTGSQDEVVKLIERTFQEEGEVMDTAEAARLIEDELLKRLEKVAQAQKLQKRLAPSTSQAAPSKPAPVVPQQTQPQMKTLTNRQSASRPLSARERAIAAFKGDKV